MKIYIDARSSDEGRVTSRLPDLTSEEQEIISGTADFLGLNHYTTELVYDAFDNQDFDTTSYYKDREANTEQDFTWPAAESIWLKEVFENDTFT